MCRQRGCMGACMLLGSVCVWGGGGRGQGLQAIPRVMRLLAVVAPSTILQQGCRLVAVWVQSSPLSAAVHQAVVFTVFPFSIKSGVLLFHCNRSSSAAVVSGYHPNCPPWCQRHMAAVPRWQAPRVLHPSRPRQPPRPLSRTCSSRQHSSRARQEEQQR